MFTRDADPWVVSAAEAAGVANIGAAAAATFTLPCATVDGEISQMVLLANCQISSATVSYE